MVDLFDPVQMRCEVLRRMAEASVMRTEADLNAARPSAPSVWAKCGEELWQWLRHTPQWQFCSRLARRQKIAETTCCSEANLDAQATDGVEESSATGATASASSATRSETSSAGTDSANLEATEHSASTSAPQTESASSSAPVQPVENDASASGGGAETSSSGPASASAAATPPASAPSATAPPNTQPGAGEPLPQAQIYYARVPVPTPPQGTTITRVEPGQARPGFPARAIWKHIKASMALVKEDLKVSVFLSFPERSLFRDTIVEELFQWHYMQQWWPRVDWSAVALSPMFIWDILANPPYRFSLVLLFYGSFAGVLLMHNVLFFATRTRPWRRRVWHNVFLCLFFLGRCIICQPLFSLIFFEGETIQNTQVQAATSLMGLSLTNLPMVFTLQLQTLDMIIFCFVHGVVSIVWILFALQIPLANALHTLYVGNFFVSCVCIWQQHEREKYERRSFEHELMMERGLLLRSADRLVRQATKVEFDINMHYLYKARRAEHLNF